MGAGATVRDERGEWYLSAPAWGPHLASEQVEPMGDPELPVAFAALDADPDVRAIVLTGSGKNFSYGLDLPAMGGLLAPLLAGGLAKERADFHTALRAMQQAITAVADCRTPTIASIQGWCIGGGVDLISAVDIRYASADAKFSVREVKLAIVADNLQSREERIGAVLRKCRYICTAVD